MENLSSICRDPFHWKTCVKMPGDSEQKHADVLAKLFIKAIPELSFCETPPENSEKAEKYYRDILDILNNAQK